MTPKRSFRLSERLQATLTNRDHFAIDKASYVPLYVQVKSRLLAIIRQFAMPGEEFFSEQELTDAFGVSRLTIREALKGLVEDGVLHRVRGRGTFIASPRVAGTLNRLTNYFADWSAQGKTVSVAIMAFEETECPGWAAPRLSVQEGSPVMFIKRLRAIDGTPVALDCRYLPLEVATVIEEEELLQRPIYEILASRRPLDPPVRAEFELYAVNADANVSGVLKASRGAPLLVRQHVLRSAGARALSVGRSFFRADLTKWLITLPVTDDRDTQADAWPRFSAADQTKSPQLERH